MVDGLGIDRFFVQAGDWGSVVSSWLGLDFPAHVAALHLNMVPLRPPLTRDGTPTSAAEAHWIAGGKNLHASVAGYTAIQPTQPPRTRSTMPTRPAARVAWVES